MKCIAACRKFRTVKTIAVLLSTLVLLAFSGCMEDPAGSPPEPTCSDGIQNSSEQGTDCGGESCRPCLDGFTAISPTDPNGLPLGPPDPTDWSWDSLWSGGERDLLDVNGLAEMKSAEIELSPAYPNPTRGSFILTLATPPENGLELRLALVDPDFEPLLFPSGNGMPPTVRLSLSLPATHRHAISLDLPNLEGFQPNATYRLYYTLVQGQILLYKGHGDIRHLQ